MDFRAHLLFLVFADHAELQIVACELILQGSDLPGSVLGNHYFFTRVIGTAVLLLYLTIRDRTIVWIFCAKDVLPALCDNPSIGASIIFKLLFLLLFLRYYGRAVLDLFDDDIVILDRLVATCALHAYLLLEDVLLKNFDEDLVGYH